MSGLFYPILFNHRSFQKSDPFPWVSKEVFQKEGSLERMGKVALELYPLQPRPMGITWRTGVSSGTTMVGSDLGFSK